MKLSAKIRAVSKDRWSIKLIFDSMWKTCRSLFFMFSIMMLLAFQFNIGEPLDFNLESATTYLIALGTAGVPLVLLVGVFSVMPGLLHRMMASGEAWLLTPTSIAVCVVPAFIVVISSMIYLATGWAWMAPEYVMPVWTAAIGLAIMTHVRNLEKQCNSGASGSKIMLLGSRQISRALLLLLQAGVWGVFIFEYLIFVVKVFKKTGDSAAEANFTIVLWVLYCIAASIVVVRAKTSRQVRVAVVLSLMSAVALSAISRNPGVIPRAAIRLSGIGEKPARLVVSEKACETINSALAGRPICALKHGKTQAVICPAVLVINKGGSAVLRVAPFRKDGIWPDEADASVVPIASSDVLSSPRIDLKSQQADPTPSAKSVAIESDRPVDMATYNDMSHATATEKRWLTRQCGIEPSPLPAASAAPPATTGNG